MEKALRITFAGLKVILALLASVLAAIASVNENQPDTSEDYKSERHLTDDQYFYRK